MGFCLTVQQNNNAATKPVADLWFDSNRMIVLRAGTKEFCVPLCILTARSRVFRDLLNRAQTSALRVAVQLSDRPDYTEYFLRALYDSGFFESPPGRCQLEHALGILTLSTKYEVAYLRRRSLSHLATCFPATLDGWRSHLQTSTFYPITEYSVPYAENNIPKTLSVLRILNQAGAVWLLPSALYECCRYDLKDLITNPSWTDAYFDSGLKDTIIIGYNRQVQEARKVLGFLHRPLAIDCPDSSSCLEVRRQHAEECFSTWSMNNPLGIWDEEDWLLLDELCPPCLEAAKATHAEDCHELWQKLPSLYDLPPWEKLLELRDSAMI